MSTLRITREVRFEMSHALHGHDGKCARIHGHSYTLSVTVRGKPEEDPASPKNGMVMDFADLNSLLKMNVLARYDHALVLAASSPQAGALGDREGFGNILTVPFLPTCENLTLDIVRRIRDALPAHVTLVSVRLRETATSYCEWHLSDNEDG